MPTHDSSEVHRYSELAEVNGERFSLAHFVHAIQRYARMIIVSFLGVGVLYAIIAIGVWLWQPSQHVAALPFRLDFDGATEGRYPNHLKFTPSEIVATPVLIRVFNANGLNRYMPFSLFSRSIVVIESNRAYENLVAEYQARLSDTRLTPVDRERVEREFEMKRQSINKNEFSLVMTTARRLLPDTMTKKVLSDILATWAAIAVHEKRVIRHRIAVLSPKILEFEANGNPDYVVALQILRSRIHDVIANIEAIRETIPGSELLRTPNEGRSLAEIKLQLEELTRFRIDPLTVHVWTSGLVVDRAATLRFLEAKRAYNERTLKSIQQAAEVARQAYADYSSAPTLSAASMVDHGDRRTRPESGTETVMPQMSEGFLDRLVELASSSRDAKYRQALIEEAKERELRAIPYKAAVEYDTLLINTLRSAGVTPTTLSETSVKSDFEKASNDVRSAIEQVNAIYELASRNLNPQTELYTATAPVTVRVERPVSITRLALLGMLVLLISLPLILFLAFLHNRIREEEVLEERREAATHGVAPGATGQMVPDRT